MIHPTRTTPLTGRVRGNSRHALTIQATQEAATYYGTPCVEVILTNEEAETAYIDDTRFGEPPTLSTGPTIYTANYQAITHPDTTDTCPKCGKETR